MPTLSEQFLAADLSGRAALAADPNAQAELARLLGSEAFARYQALAERVRRATAGHLAGAKRKFIFVPGIMGSLLQPEKLAGVWWIDARTAKQRMNDLCLAPDGVTDLNPAFAVRPFGIDFSYDPFLAVCLDSDEFDAVPFAYDWRKLPTLSTAALKSKVEELHAESREPVNIVAHSMGGLLVRAMLAELRPSEWNMIGQIVFVATPHYGSPAIAAYLKNHLWGMEMIAVLGLVLSRATFRSMRGALSLLPAPTGVYPGTRQPNPGAHPCANFDLQDAKSWRLNLDDRELAQLQGGLDAAARFHRDIYAAHQGLDPDQRRRMLVIAGVGFKTVFRFEIHTHVLGIETTDKITSRVDCTVNREGDGRVPLASALLEDVDYRYVRGEHGGLMNLEGVYADVFNWFRQRPLKLPDTCQAALAGHLAPEDDLNLVPAPAAGDDPGFLVDQPLDPARAAELLTALDEGRLPGFERTRIF